MRATAAGQEQEPSFRFTSLLTALAALVVLDVFAPAGTAGDFLTGVAFLAVIVLTVRALARRRSVLLLTMGFGVLGFAARVVSVFSEQQAVEIAGQLGATAFMGFAAGIILGEVLRARKVTHEQIAGAICSYVLIGIAWSGLYGVSYLLDPASLSLPAWAASEPVPRGGGLIYFSFVTLTTLGYGDIVPVAPPVRTLAWVEAVFGQIYLAVLVARLVSLHVTHSQRG